MLTPRAIEELAGKMVACPSMKFLNRRRSIVSGLPEKISTRIPEDDTPIFHVVSIIQACNEHEGGIDELIERMDFFEGGSTPFQQVQECWQKLSNRGIVDPDEKQKLYRLATKFNLDEEALSELYWASLPKGIQALGSATTLHAVLEHLWDMPKQPDEVLPVVEFVERLARRASKIGKLLPARKLKGWINEKASYLGMTRSHLDQMRARMDGETASLPLPPPSLLVELVPDDDNRNKPKTYSQFLSTMVIHKNP